MVNAKILTPLELKIMKILWRRERGFVKDILDSWDEEPLPAYNTVSTIVRILEEKQFVQHTAYGRTHEYTPLISEQDYKKNFLTNAIQQVFGSSASLVSTLMDSEKISPKEMDEIRNLLNMDN